MLIRREQANTELICLEEESGYCEWNAQQIKDHFKTGSALLVYESKVLKGSLLFRNIEQEFEILSITVDPGFRRQGVANQLVEGLIDLAKQTCKDSKGVIFLEVAEDNEIAREFYLKKGFSILYRREKYYENGAAALIMEYRV